MFLKKLFDRGKRDGETVHGTADVSFTIEWTPAVNGRVGVLEQAHLLMTDVCPLSAADVTAIKTGIAANVSGPVVLAAPAFTLDALDLVSCGNLYGVIATDVGVQRADELLLDLATLTNGKMLSAAFGIGLPKPPVGAKTPGGLRIPGMSWTDFTADSTNLGLARKVTIADTSLTVEMRAEPRELNPHLAGLLSQFKSAITDADREAAARRYVRFGRSPGEPPPPQSLNISDHALRIPGGYASLFLITDPGRGCADWQNPFVLVAGSELTSIGQLMGPLEFAVANKLTPLAVIAPRIRQGALSLLVLNKMLGILDAVALQVGSDPQTAASLLENLASATGTAVIRSLTDRSPVNLSSFGRASRLVATRGWTFVECGK